MTNIIKMNRLFDDGDTTLGVMDCLGFPCTTLEDENRAIKVAGETRIPAGIYQIKLRTEGGMVRRYRERFGHQGMLWLQDVPNFEYVYIHIGNDDEDTAGCILVGRTMDTDKFTIGTSRITYCEVYDRVIAYLNEGEEVWISISDVSII